MKISIVVPTYNESENIQKLIHLLNSALNNYNHEIVIVDDNSSDGTVEITKKNAEKYPVKMIVRKKKSGLALAILTGFRNSTGEILGVIDADLQHPPELIVALIDKIRNGYDIAIASRYVEGGGMEDWSFFRKTVSKGAIMLTKPLTKVKDPMSGYFMLRRDIIAGVNFKHHGYKLLLEILVKGNYIKVAEIPYIFTKRMAGESKLNASEYWKYIRLLLHLYKVKLLNNAFSKRNEDFSC